MPEEAYSYSTETPPSWLGNENMADGYWQLDFVEADPETAARANIMFVQYLHDLQETAPEALNGLTTCLKLSQDPEFVKKLGLVDLTKLIPRRETCRRCDGIIEYDDVSEHEWNLEAMKQGFCSALCLEYRGDEQ